MTTMMTSARLPMVTARRGGAYPGRWRGRLGGIPEPRAHAWDEAGNEYVLLAPGPGSTIVPFVVSDTPGGVSQTGAAVEDVTLSPGQNVVVPVVMPGGTTDTYVIVRAQSKLRVWGLMVGGAFALGWAGGYLTWVKLGKKGYGGGVGYTPVYGPPKKRSKRSKW